MGLHTIALASIAAALTLGAYASFRIALRSEHTEWTDSHPSTVRQETASRQEASE